MVLDFNSAHLVQLDEHNAQEVLLVHLLCDGTQVVPDRRGTEAAVELGHVVVVEGERLVHDGHRSDLSDRALMNYNRGGVNTFQNGHE